MGRFLLQKQVRRSSSAGRRSLAGSYFKHTTDVPIFATIVEMYV
jgi:hypothetical protein